MLTNVYRREIIERFLADKPAAERDLLLPVEGVSEPMGAGAIDEICGATRATRRTLPMNSALMPQG